MGKSQSRGIKTNIAASSYQIEQDLGSGSFGKVVQVTDQETGELCAVKLIPRGSPSQCFTTEVLCHRQLHHPNIIGFKELLLTPTHIAVAMELAPLGDLFTFFWKTMGGHVGEKLALYFFQQLTVALDYCHSHGICVRDIKLENCLLGGAPSAPIAKLCDFGFAKSELENSVCESRVGTFLYIAPEVLTCNSYDGKDADVWSLGVLLYTLLIGQYPFQDPLHPKSDYHTMQRVINGSWHVPSSTSLSPECIDLLHKMLRSEPSERIKVRDILKHPWLNSSFMEYLQKAEYLSTAYPQSIQSLQNITHLLQEAGLVSGGQGKGGFSEELSQGTCSEANLLPQHCEKI